jgi:GGDEF domain-containing protein
MKKNTIEIKFGDSITLTKTVSELCEMAFKDPLSGLYNRNMLEELRPKFDKECWFVTIIDIDGLKCVNDKYGHEAGDMTIAKIAFLLRRLSNYVFRLGGDEFLMMSSTYTYKDVNAIGGISHGVIWKKAEESLSQAMKTADEKMYEMKNQKKREGGKM